MKELSIEDKAKAYDKALEALRSLIAEQAIKHCDRVNIKDITNIFSELKESEDERMLNQLHSWMKEFGGAEEYTEKVYQWIKGLLEKQGEQKPAWSEEDEVCLGDAMWAIEQARTIAKDENDMGNLWYAERWLKSLRHQNRWKPSDEQMKALEDSIEFLGCTKKVRDDLK